MENPFKVIDARLRNIENMILEIRYPYLAAENRSGSSDLQSASPKKDYVPNTTKIKKGGSDGN